MSSVSPATIPAATFLIDLSIMPWAPKPSRVRSSRLPYRAAERQLRTDPLSSEFLVICPHNRPRSFSPLVRTRDSLQTGAQHERQCTGDPQPSGRCPDAHPQPSGFTECAERSAGDRAEGGTGGG